jgi:hypothetical protein
MLAGASLLSGCVHATPNAYFAPYSAHFGPAVDGDTHY